MRGKSPYLNRGGLTEDGGNPFIGPGPGGIVGAIPYIIVAIYLVKNWEK